MANFGDSRKAAISIFGVFFLQMTVVLGCTYLDGVKYVGSPSQDIATLSMASREACCLECTRIQDCTSFNYGISGIDANKCSLKNSSWTQVADPKYSSGVSSATCTFLENTELPLFTIYTYENISSKEMCCSSCGSIVKCAGFTYYKSGPKAKKCEVKYAVNNKVPTTSVVSGITAGGQCTFENNVDYRGFDIQTVTNVASKLDCCNKCKATVGCNAFSYAISEPKMKSCVLKSSSVSMIPNANAVSGRVSGLTCTGFN